MAHKKITINRAPVLTLWAAIVAERQGYAPDTALTLGQSLAGLNAQSKGRRLGIYEAKKETPEAGKKQVAAAARPESVRLLGREVPTVKTAQGLRAAVEGKPVDPLTVEAYLEKKFGADLAEARLALQALARSYSPAKLEEQAFSLYEKFRPTVPEGK